MAKLSLSIVQMCVDIVARKDLYRPVESDS